MDFSLSEEQELLQETLRGFVERECPATRVRELFDAGTGFAPDLWQALAEMGVCGLLVPETLGGAGLGLLELALVFEELGRGCVPAPLLGHALATVALRAGGSPAQQERWLPAMAAGTCRATVALAEAGGFEPSGWRTRLEAGRIHGSKRFVPGLEQADLVVVALGGGGLALWEPAAGGGRIEAVDPLDRTRPSAHLHLERAIAEPLPVEGAADRILDAGCALLAADAFGVGHALVRASVRYCSTRTQFGRPLAAFQAVKHQLADMALQVDPSRGLYWYAAHAFDALPGERTRAAALAKAHITDRAMQVARDAVEAHGGLGFTWECDVQIAFKRALFDRQFLGPPALHRERVARLGGW